MASMRSARTRTCAADSSPLTYSTVRPEPDRAARAATIEQQGRLPDAGLAGHQDHGARDDAAPRTVELADG